MLYLFTSVLLIKLLRLNFFAASKMYLNLSWLLSPLLR
jgi:hypothetical protein